MHMLEAPIDNVQQSAQFDVAEALLVMGNYQNQNENQFLADSGATHHVVNSKRWFVAFDKRCSTREVIVGSNHRLLVFGHGTAQLTVALGSKRITITLKNVLYVPRMRRNLISLGQLAEEGRK